MQESNRFEIQEIKTINDVLPAQTVMEHILTGKPTLDKDDKADFFKVIDHHLKTIIENDKKEKYYPIADKSSWDPRYSTTALGIYMILLMLLLILFVLWI